MEPHLPAIAGAGRGDSAEKFSWRPAPGVRSIGEVYMHIAIANFYLLSVTGPKEPAVEVSMEKTVTQKADVIDWLKRSLDAVATARAQLKPADYQRKVTIYGKVVTVDGMYLRIIVHANEHMGQSIAYARMNGIVPPWSKPIAAPAMQETQTPFALALISGYPGPWPRFASSSRH